MKQIEPVFEYIETKAESLQSEAEPTPETAVLLEKFSKIKTYWTSVSQRVLAREEAIVPLLPAAEKYHTTQQKFVAQKNKVEQKIHAIQPVPAHEASLRKQHDMLQVLYLNCCFCGCGTVPYSI